MPNNYNESSFDHLDNKIETDNEHSWLKAIKDWLTKRPPYGFFADKDGDFDPSWQDIIALRNYFVYSVLSNYGIFYPIRMLLRSLISPFKAYKSPWKIPKDLLQPLWGVGNLCLAVGILTATCFFAIIQALAQLVLLSMYMCYFISQLTGALIAQDLFELENNPFSNLIILVLSVLSIPFGIWLGGIPALFIGMITSALVAVPIVGYGILDAATHAVYGVAQILTSPLLLVTMPIRLLMTAINGFEKIEQNKSIVAVVRDSQTNNSSEFYEKSFSKIFKYMSLNEYCKTRKLADGLFVDELLSKYAQKKYDHLVSQGRMTAISGTKPADITCLKWLVTEVKTHNPEAFEESALCAK